MLDVWIVYHELLIQCKSRKFFEAQASTVTDVDTVAIMSQCGRGPSMCRLGGAGKAAVRCWVGVPNHVTRLLVVQGLGEFRLATCLFLSLAADLIDFLGADKEEIMSQCERCQ